MEDNNRSICFDCGKELTVNNKSKEHIILNAIGGRLKSDRIFCKDCNSALGYEADAELAKQLEFFSGYLQVNRDNGEIPHTTGGKTADGTEYKILNGITPALARPKFTVKEVPGGGTYSITARSEDEMRSILSGLKKKYPVLDVDDAMKHAKTFKGRMKEHIEFNLVIGGELPFRSILKSAVGYFLHEGGNREDVKHLLGMIKGKEVLDIVRGYQPPDPIYSQMDNEVIHLLHLVGNEKDHILYCYVELFSAFSFVVLLSENYRGRDMTKTYANDAITGVRVKKSVLLNLSAAEILGLPSYLNNYEMTSQKVRRLMRIGNINQSANIRQRLWDEAVMEMMVEKDMGARLTIYEEMIDAVYARYAAKLIDYLPATGTSKDERNLEG